MLRAIGWTLRQPRYRAIAVFMTFLAVVFAGIGTFEVHRFAEKRHDNGVLRDNARAASVALSTDLVPLTGAPAPVDAAIRFRPVSVSGVYLPDREQYLDDQRQGGRQGFFVLTPLRTADGILLVARGFVASTSTGTRPDAVAAPPTGTVRVEGLVYPGQGRSEDIGRDEITKVDPRQQATRLGAPTFQAYLALRADQPGTAGLQALPRPDLSNPTGGAGSLQLLSYVLQWYVFALLALAAPFFLARNEVRDARRRFLGIDPDAVQFDLEADSRAHSDAETRPTALERGGGRSLVRRARADVARVRTPEQERGARLADRYGRSLGPAGESLDGARVVRRSAFVPPHERTGDADAGPYRSDDAYHGSYNDRLWQLALGADELPDVQVPPSDPPVARPTPRIVEADTRPDDTRPDDTRPDDAGADDR